MSNGSPWRSALFNRLISERKFGRELLERGRNLRGIETDAEFLAECRNWIDSLAFAINFAFEGQANDFQETILTEPVVLNDDPKVLAGEYHEWVPRFDNCTPTVDDLRLYVTLLDKWIDEYSAQIDLEDSLRCQFLGFLISRGGLLRKAMVQIGCKLEKPVFNSICQRLSAEKAITSVNDLISITERGSSYFSALSKQEPTMNLPPEIQDSMARFRKDYPDPDKTGFIIMRFGQTTAHEKLLSAIRDTLAKHCLIALRADDRQFHDDLYHNIMTYMYGCGFGIAVYERIESEEFNPNVSLEVGGMLVMGKPVCFLKDQTLRTLNTDLVGRLYKTFDPQDPKPTINNELSKWLRDKDLI